MENKACPCKRLKCPRHGDCDACRAYHAEPGRKYPCACDKKKNVEVISQETTSEIDEREKTIRLWFDMWLQQEDLGIDNIFSEDAVYMESWRPKYENRRTVKHWFEEWNTRGKVLAWEIKQFFHKENQTIAEWYFKNEMKDGRVEEFDGMSLVEWTADNKIKFMKEFGCNINNYDPYQNSDEPQFRNEKSNWF